MGASVSCQLLAVLQVFEEPVLEDTVLEMSTGRGERTLPLGHMTFDTTLLSDGLGPTPWKFIPICCDEFIWLPEIVLRELPHHSTNPPLMPEALTILLENRLSEELYMLIVLIMPLSILLRETVL